MRDISFQLEFEPSSYHNRFEASPPFGFSKYLSVAVDWCNIEDHEEAISISHVRSVIEAYFRLHRED